MVEKILSWFGSEPSLLQYRKLSLAEETNMVWAARYSVTSNIVAQLAAIIGQPLSLDETGFRHHYDQNRVLPLLIPSKLNAEQVARLQERGLSLPGVDMEM